MKAFTKATRKKLGNYVYRLIDPRNGETFYVGKGKGNRVFDHAQAKLDAADLAGDDKLTRILDIIRSGFEVDHVIHRHGLSKSEAYLVESSLIDAYPGLTNKVAGHKARDLGAMHARTIARQYDPKPAHFSHKGLLVNVVQSTRKRTPYDAARFSWPLRLDRVTKEAPYVFAVVDQQIVDVFKVNEWLPATKTNFPEFTAAQTSNKVGFIGHRADGDMLELYLDRSVPIFQHKKYVSPQSS